MGGVEGYKGKEGVSKLDYTSDPEICILRRFRSYLPVKTLDYTSPGFLGRICQVFLKKQIQAF